MTPAFVAYQQQVLANVQAMAKELTARGHHIVTGGSDVHLLLMFVIACVVPQFHYFTLYY